MNVICEICGKNFKNTQGLRGHKQFIHNQTSKKSTGVATEQLMGKLEHTATDTLPANVEHNNTLEKRLQKLERVTGIRSSNVIELLDDHFTPLTSRLASITRQLEEQAQHQEELAHQMSKLAEDLKRAETASREQWTRSAQQVETLNEADNKLAALVNVNVEKIKTDIDNIKFRMLRNPTGNVVSMCMIEVTPGQKSKSRSHRFKEYRDPQGLMRPYKTSTNQALGDRYVDLSEPED